MPLKYLQPRLFFLLFSIVPGLTSCSSYITSSFVEPAVGNLRQQTDLELVCEGAPAYLLMIDSMIASSPDNRQLLRTGTQSYTGYAAASCQSAENQTRESP